MMCERLSVEFGEHTLFIPLAPHSFRRRRSLHKPPMKPKSKSWRTCHSGTHARARRARRRSTTTSGRKYTSAAARRGRNGGIVDKDLEAMTREQLIVEARRLRAGIRAHRDSTGHALCWHHPALWGLLPETTDRLPTVPTWPEFLRGCLLYRQSLDEQLPDAPRSDAPYRP